MEILKSELKHIKELLSNHITETNKKIDDSNKKINELRQDMKDGFKEIKEMINKK